MQILYRPLRRSCRGTIGSSSPPLFTRREEEEAAEDNPLVEQEEEEEEEIMESVEFDDNGIPTVFYLNVDNLDGAGTDMEEIVGLGSNVQIHHQGEEEPFATHHYSVQEDGSIQYHHHQQNGGMVDLENFDVLEGYPSHNHIIDGGGGENNFEFEFEEVATMPVASTSILTSTSVGFTVTPPVTASVASVSIPNGGLHNNTDSHYFVETSSSSSRSSTNSSTRPQVPVKRKQSQSTKNQNQVIPSTSAVNVPFVVKEKRPKLVINLYEEETGYEFGCLLKDGVTQSQMSHLIPYTEEGDYFLQCLDREEIPVKVLKHLSPHLIWRRGHLLAEVRDYRRFRSTGGVGGSRHTNNPNFRGSVSSRNSNFNRTTLPAPVITEVLLRPTTHSILYEFDRLIDKSIRWKRKRNKVVGLPNSKVKSANSKVTISNPLSSEDDDDNLEDEDSDYEIEFDSKVNKNNNKALGGEEDEDDEMITYEQRLELEKELVNKTAGPLCLDPSPEVSLIQNRAQFERLKWRCPTLLRDRPLITNPKIMNPDLSIEEMANPRKKMVSFLKFVQSVREKERLNGNPRVVLKEDPLQEEKPFVEYPDLDPPTSTEDLAKICQIGEPSTIRPIVIENYVKKVEEYTFETERRKRPHITKLTIYQRNGIDCYFGELEMENLVEPPLPITTTTGAGPSLAALASNRPGGVINPPPPTKCQFELGSSDSVTLYVKQFSDIFTEDGRRPCKISYQKIGQVQPQVLYTNSYKAQQLQQQQQQQGTTPTSSAAATVTSPATSVTPGNIESPSSGPGASSTPATSVTITTSTSTPVTQPPVQIVHPQPRTVAVAPIQEVQIQVQPQPNVSVVNASMTMSNATATSYNQQLLTRPQVVSVSNLQKQKIQAVAGTVQQQGGSVPGPSSQSTTLTHQQILQQRLLRLKQQQAAAQAQQQPQQQTALAKLLLTNIQQTPSSSTPPTTTRPITVAVQPQQKVVNSDQQPQRIVTSGTANINGQNQGVSVNLNQMLIDGIGVGNTTQLRSQSGQTVNILRVNQQVGNQIVTTGGPVTLSQAQSTPVVTASSLGSQPGYHQNLSALLQGTSSAQSNQSPQRILINANNGQQITLASPGVASSSGTGASEIEKLSVPDLTSLLAGSGTSPATTHHIIPTTPQTSHHHHLTHTHGGDPNQTHNLNLNLNVNLNSSSVISTSDAVNSQGAQGGPPPFLVFISPLRSVPLSINTNQTVTRTVPTTTTLLQQHLNAPQTPHQITVQHPQAQTQEMIMDTSGMGTGDILTFETAGGQEIKIEPGMVDSSQNGNMVISGNTAYSVNVSSSSGTSGDKKDPGIITLSDLLGSSSSASSTSRITSTSSALSSLILQNNGNPQQIVVSSSGTQGQGVMSSVISSTPRLSALLAGTPSADSGSRGGAVSNDRTLLDRLAASLSSSSGGGGPSSSTPSSTTGSINSTTSPTRSSGLNPIATATPNVVLEHPVLAATLTGTQPSPKLVPAYRQIAPAPTNSVGRKHP